MTENTKFMASIAEKTAELAQILTDDPSMEHKIREIIEYHLKKGIDGKTFGKIRDSLYILVGPKVSQGIMVLCIFGEDKFFEEMKGEIAGKGLDKALPFLQYITALYGYEIEKAYRVFDEEPNDWLNARVFVLNQKGEEEEWFVEIDITKNNGEKVYLRMQVLSAFDLAERLLRAIGGMPEVVIEEKVIERFNKETKDFQKKFLGKGNSED